MKKFPIPNFFLLFFLIFFGGSACLFWSSYQQLHNRTLLDYSGPWFNLIGSGFNCVMSVGLFVYQILAGQSFHLWGETFKADTELFANSSFIVGPMHSLSGIFIDIDLLSRCPKYKLPKMESFRLYRQTFTAPAVKYELTLFNGQSGNTVVVAQHTVNESLPNIDVQGESAFFQLLVPQSVCQSQVYWMRIDRFVTDEPDYEVFTQHVRIDLGVKAKDVLKKSKASVREARLEVLPLASKMPVDAG